MESTTHCSSVPGAGFPIAEKTRMDMSAGKVVVYILYTKKSEIILIFGFEYVISFEIYAKLFPLSLYLSTATVKN